MNLENFATSYSDQLGKLSVAFILTSFVFGLWMSIYGLTTGY